MLPDTSRPGCNHAPLVQEIQRVARPLTGEAEDYDALLERVGDARFVLLGEASHIELNREALAQLGGEKRLEIIPGAGHLFEEPGTLDQVARLAADWFDRYLGRVAATRAA